MNRFKFIKDEVLRENLNNTFQHIKNLIEISKDIEPLAKHAFYKTIIVYVATIIEAILIHTCLCQKNINLKFEISKNKWKYFEPKTYYKLENGDEIVMCKRKKQTETLNKKTTFKKIITFYKQKKLLGTTLLKDIEEVSKINIYS